MKFKEHLEPDYLGAGIVFLTPDYKTLLLQKTNNKWSFPGGHAEIGEDPYQTAKRECYEETGFLPKNKAIGLLKFPGPEQKDMYSFFVKIKKPFKPKLSSEHKDYIWKNVKKVSANQLTKIFTHNWDQYIAYIDTIL